MSKNQTKKTQIWRVAWTFIGLLSFASTLTGQVTQSPPPPGVHVAIKTQPYGILDFLVSPLTFGEFRWEKEQFYYLDFEVGWGSSHAIELSLGLRQFTPEEYGRGYYSRKGRRIRLGYRTYLGSNNKPLEGWFWGPGITFASGETESSDGVDSYGRSSTRAFLADLSGGYSLRVGKGFVINGALGPVFGYQQTSTSTVLLTVDRKPTYSIDQVSEFDYLNIQLNEQFANGEQEILAISGRIYVAIGWVF